jgi:4-hydroxybenzoate polyprenyltransferase
MLAVCLVTSSNYVLNEVMDAPFDRLHWLKASRPVPSGRVNARLALLEWVLLIAAGLGIASLVSTPFVVTMAILWLMGCLYNLPPLRTKDVPYLDVLSEAVNNPLRMLAGWFISGSPLMPSASLLLSYWMVGCYFMALKRYAEYRDLNNPATAAAYRKSFRYYTLERLLSAVVFYSSAAMLFFGAFLMRYRFELLLAVPFIALVMAVYLSLAFKPDSAVQRPEGLYREPLLMLSVTACLVVMAVLFFVDIPQLRTIFSPTLPVVK